MTVRLPDHLDLIAHAPDGTRKLRGLILELAVRGKLVPQDPNDEPASELLKRIAKERARLEVEGTCKKSKAKPLDAGDAPPFELPAGWVLSQLSDLALVLNGRAYSKDELLSEGVPVLRVGNLFTSNHWYYSNLQLEADKYCDQGDLLYSWSASFGPFIWQGPKVIYHYHIWKLRLFDESSLSKEFFYKFLLEKTAEIKAAGHGVSMIHMTKEKMEKILVPVPPLVEQHRIVTKVDELMALCDRLEAEQADAGTAHARLVATLLGTLTQSTGAAELAANWQRLAEHFDTLFTSEASLDALKQTILQLAVMGKLVPQDRNDEPAGELLKRIAKERARLEAEGVCKKSKVTPVVGQSELPFALPKGWEWSRLAGVSLINPRNAADDSTIASFVPMAMIGTGFEGAHSHEPRKWGDIKQGFTHFAEGDIGVAKITPCFENSKACVFAKLQNGLGAGTTELHIVRPIGSTLVPHYVLAYLKAPMFLLVGETRMTGTAGQKRLPKEFLELNPFPLPPLAEQHRIVAKVDELMALCDRLKAGLAESRTRQERLAATLIESALQAA